MAKTVLSSVLVKTDFNRAGFAVFDGVGDGFLGNAIEMGGDGLIGNGNRAVGLETTIDVEEFFRVRGQFLERRHQSFGFQDKRRQAARQRAGLRNDLANLAGDLSGLGGLGLGFLLQDSARDWLFNSMPAKCWQMPSCKSCPMRRCSISLMRRISSSNRLRSVMSVRMAMYCAGFPSAFRNGKIVVSTQ